MNDNLPNYTTSDTNWSLIPEYMVGAVRRYIEHGIEPGDFLSALICNDLSSTFAYADHNNVRLIHNYVRFFYNYAPSECWGSHEKFNNWVKNKGLNWNVAVTLD